MVRLFVTINDIRSELDMYGDESINMTSKLKDLRDISKVFTDFSQEFSIPASGKNNQILKHFYNNEIYGEINELPFLDKVIAAIDVDGVVYKNGLIQYKKAVFKDGKLTDHKISYSGPIGTLKEVFGETKLRDLNFSQYDHKTNAENTRLAVRFTSSIFNNDIVYPLINSTDTEWNVTNMTNLSLEPEIMKPAIRSTAILEAINEYTNLNFVIDPTFEFVNKIYMWCPNSPPDNSITSTDLWYDTITPAPPNNTMVDYDGLISFVNFPGEDGIFHNSKWHFDVIADPGDFWSVKLWKNENPDSEDWVETSLEHTGTGSASFNLTTTSYVTGNKYAKWVLDGLDGAVINVSYWVETGTWSAPLYYRYTASNAAITIQDADHVYSNRMPNIKVIDWFKGFVKMFNLVPVVSTSDYRTITLYKYNEWVSRGKIIDLTKDINTKEVSILIPSRPKQISLKYKESKAFDYVRYLNDTGINYGDRLTDVGGNGANFKVELPFHNMLWQLTEVGGNLLVGKAQEFTNTVEVNGVGDRTGLDGITDEIYFMFLEEASGSAGSNPINFNGWSAPVPSYKAFNTFSAYGPIPETLNFDGNLNFHSNQIVDELNNLYSEYENLIEYYVNITARIYTYEAFIPVAVLSQIELNDIIQIRDKFFKINSIKSNLLTRKTKLELLHYVRENINNGGSSKSQNVDNIAPDTSLMWVDTGAIPPTPNNITSNNITNKTFTLGWDQPAWTEDIIKYNIYKYGILYDTVVGNPPVTTLDIVGQTPSYVSAWTVLAIDDMNGISNQSTPKVVKMVAPPSLEFQDPFVIEEINPTTIDISWTPAVPITYGITGYTIFVDNVEVNTVNSEATSLTIQLLNNDTEYAIKVMVGDSNGGTDFSTEILVTTGIDIPTTPTNLSASTITQDSFNLTWDASTSEVNNIVQYDIYRNGEVSGSTVGLPPANSFTVSGMSEVSGGTLSGWQVVAIDDGALSSLSSTTLNVTMLPVPVPSITQTSNSISNSGLRTQLFYVGEDIVGGTYHMQAYGHTVSYSPIGGENYSDVILALVNLINNTSEIAWDSEGKAPYPLPVNGFKPTAIVAGLNPIMVTLDINNQFNAWVDF